MTEIDTKAIHEWASSQFDRLDSETASDAVRSLCDALDEARLEARNLHTERDAAHREVADRMAEIAAARAELEAFAGSPLPPGLASPEVVAVVSATSAFIGRMRAALGGAQ